MRIGKLLSLLSLLTLTLLRSPSLALQVPLVVNESAGVERKAEPLTVGVPFARGAVKDVARLNLSQGGQRIAAQFVATVPWDDGSVRWALLDTQLALAANGQTTLVVSDSGGVAAPAGGVNVQQSDEAVSVSTGPLEFVIDKKGFNLFKSIKVDGRELVSANGRGLVIYKAGGGEAVAAAPSEIKVENAGPMRATICLRGRFPDQHNGLLGYTVRITAYARQRYLKVHAWLENDGSLTVRGKGRAKWFAFDGMAVELGLTMGNELMAGCEDVTAKGNFKVEQLGGPTHDWKGFNYTITSKGEKLKSGDHTDGLVIIGGSGGRIAVGVRHFWQQYEKAIELDGSALRIWLWPTSGEWPRSTGNRGKDSREYPDYRKPGLYHLSGSTRKGHEMLLDFSGRGAVAASATLSTPLFAMPQPAYIAGTEAAPGNFAPADFRTGKADYDAKVESWNRCALNGIDTNLTNRGSLYFARNGGADRLGSWHGWMDFGDNLWAEGYSSLHYDWSWIMLLNLLRSGNQGFLEMGTTMARHTIDIDHIWGDKDSQFYAMLSRYEKCYTSIHGGINDGHYGPIPTHTWASGMILYYMLTGEPQARECAIETGEGIRRRTVSLFRNGPATRGQSRESGWSILNFCSLYDLTADKNYLDDALLLFRNNLMAQRDQLGLYLQAQTAPGNCLQFYYCIQGFCELYERTGDAGIMNYLKECCEGDYEALRPAYKEWRIFFANLYAYVGWKNNNAAYIAKAESLFNEYVPAGSPPCFRSGGGAWDKESGKLLRNGHILQFVEWKLKNQGAAKP